MKHGKKILFFLCAIVVIGALSAVRFFRSDQQASSPPTDKMPITTIDAPIPAGSHPWGLTSDAQGNLWIALPGCDPNPRCKTGTPPGKIVVYQPDETRWLATYTLPAGYAQPLFLDFDAKGRLWFTMFQTNSLGMFNPVDKSFHQWTVPTPKAGPWDIDIDSKGNIWFTEHYVNKIGRFDPNTQTFFEVATPALKSYPYGIAIDAQDNVWFTENNRAVALIGVYTNKGQLLEYKPYQAGHKITPHLIAVDSRGNIWWTEGISGRIGRLDIKQAKPGTSEGVSEFIYEKPCKTCEVHTSGIAIDHSGNVWFTDSLQGIFGFFPEDGQNNSQFTVYNTLTAYSHPHDGLIVDKHNRVWFTEETANQLGLAIRSDRVS